MWETKRHALLKGLTEKIPLFVSMWDRWCDLTYYIVSKSDMTVSSLFWISAAEVAPALVHVYLI